MLASWIGDSRLVFDTPDLEPGNYRIVEGVIEGKMVRFWHFVDKTPPHESYVMPTKQVGKEEMYLILQFVDS